MGEKFGARLRQQREAQQVSLDTVARQTKIKLTLLDAMEHDDVSAWPGGLFRRAFVRAYAQAVGLDPEGAVREFLADFPDRVVRDPWTGASGDGPAKVVLPVARPEAWSRQTAAVEPEPAESWPTERPANEQAAADQPAIIRIGDGSPAADPEPSILVKTPPAVPDLDAIAQLCTALGRVDRAEDVEPLLEKFAQIVEAKGVIIWVWDEPVGALRPAVSHGYPTHVMARLRAVTRDADNPTAEAFRTERPCTICGRGDAAAALVVPLLTSAGSIGALGIEFERGVEPTSGVTAVATIVAAFLSQLVGVQSMSLAAGAPTASRESA